MDVLDLREGGGTCLYIELPRSELTRRAIFRLGIDMIITNILVLLKRFHLHVYVFDLTVQTLSVSGAMKSAAAVPQQCLTMLFNGPDNPPKLFIPCEILTSII